MPNRVYAGTWAPVAPPTMRHILAQILPPQLAQDDVARTTSMHFMAPATNPLHFASQVRQFGEVTAILMTLSAMRVLRGIPSTAGMIHVGFVLSGTVILRPLDEEPIFLGPGDVCSISDWSQFEVESTDSTRGLHLLLPESRLLAHGVRQPGLRTVLDGPRSLRAPLRTFALSLSDPSWQPSAVGALAAEQALEHLVAGLFLERRVPTADRDDERLALVARALAEVAKQHTNPGLNPATLAQRLTVSLRHLQRAFEATDTTLARSIWHARIQAASMLLSSPDAPNLTMAEIATRSGFSSTFELRSAFRSEFGVLPSEYRDSRRGETRA